MPAFLSKSGQHCEQTIVDKEIAGIAPVWSAAMVTLASHRLNRWEQ